MHNETMITTRRILTAAAAAVLVSASSTAFAEGWYVGAGLGSSTMKDAETALIGTSFDDKDSAFKIFAGYQFNPHVAVEMGYADFGKFTASISGVNIDNWEATGISVSAVGTLPLGGDFSLSGKLGITRWDVDDKIPLIGYSASETGTELTFGIGAQYDFNKQFGVRVEWEKFPDLGEDDTTGKSDVEVLSASAVVRF